jgi:hypothetical protein
VGSDGINAFRVRNADLPGLDSILTHSVFRPDVSWLDHYQQAGSGERTHFLQAQGSAFWYALPHALCFSVLLNSRTVLNERPSDLDRLNRARSKRGRRPLLDHVEVSLRLGSRYAQSQGRDAANRRSPRLHVVRGHPVQRAGKTFWRSTHVRGEGEQLVGSRTVTVRGSH